MGAQARSEPAPTSGQPELRLWRVQEVEDLELDMAVLRQISHWCREYLAKPHDQLGRPGDVCPFVGHALRSRTIWLATVPRVMSAVEMKGVVAAYREKFLKLEPSSGSKRLEKAVLIVFPHVALDQARELIDTVQAELKVDFVDVGLMIGEFHQMNDAPGLHNPDFHPLRSPIPMLAIRHMVESDLVFLTRDFDAPHVRVRYLTSYIRNLPDLAAEKLARAETALRRAEAEMNTAQTKA